MIWVPTVDLIYKNLTDGLPRGVAEGDWDVRGRVALAETHKHRSIFQHFVDGVPWGETVVFTELYVERFRPADSKNGRRAFEKKLARYHNVLDGVFERMKRNGFEQGHDLPLVLIGREGTIMLGNQGNHRVAMAKVLKIKQIPCEVRTRHGQWQWLREQTGCDYHPDRL